MVGTNDGLYERIDGPVALFNDDVIKMFGININKNRVSSNDI